MHFRDPAWASVVHGKGRSAAGPVAASRSPGCASDRPATAWIKFRGHAPILGEEEKYPELGASMSGFSGAFPGGPRKSAPVPARVGPPRLSRVEEIEERAARRGVRRRHRKRGMRIAYGLAASLVGSGVMGLVLGLSTHETRADVQAEAKAAEEAQRANADVEAFSSEVNRTLLELWKMEDVEFSRNSR